FGNDQFTPIHGYEDLVQGNVTINRVYNVKGLNHNLFLVGQFHDADLEVAFRKSTCFVRDIQGNDLLTGLVPQQQKASDYDNPDPVPQRQDVSSLADADVPSQQELDLLFSLLYDEFFNAEEGEHLQDDKFTNPFCAPAQEEAESTSHNIGNSNVPTYNQPQVSEYQWTKHHPLEQVRGNPSRPVQTRRQLATDPEMCMYALTGRLQIHQSPRGIFINQARYTLEILHKHGMNKGQSIGTPMAMKPKLDADLSGNPVDQTDYRSKIRSLMYLTSSRPDIVQAVCFCAGYQSRPTKKHLKEDKMIFRYLRGTVNMGLWYPKGSSFELTAFQMLIMPDALILAKALLEEFNS
nr:uncharacterized mitochondrial protein AtMg00810-like [Tanacetum cinerariifolium]